MYTGKSVHLHIYIPNTLLVTYYSDHGKKCTEKNMYTYIYTMFQTIYS